MRWTRAHTTAAGLALGGFALGAVALAAGMSPWWIRSRPAAGTTRPATDGAFERTVRPFLARRCKPCHEPGGVMYGRIPFDDPKAVRDHRGGILRRLKAADEVEALRAWLDGKS